MISPSPVFVAIDTPDLERAQGLARSLAGAVGGLKLGKEFFTAHGPAGVRELRETGLPVFLDLKFHDIPNTVAGAVRAATALDIDMLTVHATGGPAMIAAARAASRDGAAAACCRQPLVLAVTVLTSLDEADLEAVGQTGPVADQVERLAVLAAGAGADGIVASPREVKRLRARMGADIRLVVPGIRPGWAVAGDQKRVTTPREAMDMGADILVIGRPITEAEDPAAAARKIAAEISAAHPPGG